MVAKRRVCLWRSGEGATSARTHVAKPDQLDTSLVLDEGENLSFCVMSETGLLLVEW